MSEYRVTHVSDRHEVSDTGEVRSLGQRPGVMRQRPNRDGYASVHIAGSFGADPHPVGGYDFVHRDGYWTIVAPNGDAARTLVDAVLGTGWADMYEASDMTPDFYPRGELLRLVHPAMATQAVHLLTGPMPPNVMIETTVGERHDVEGRLLVTVWGNGQAEVAYREADDTHIGWGIPADLVPAP